MNPSMVQYEVGETKHGQPITLTKGKDGWTLTKEAADQRDDRCVIFGIPDKVLLAMADAVKKQQAIERAV